MFGRFFCSAASFVAALCLVPSIALAAEENGEGAAKRERNNGGYGAPEMKVTSLASSAGVLMGSQGGWIHRHHLIIGGAGYGLVNDVTLNRGGEKQVSLGYGGFRPGFIMGDNDHVVHFNGGVILGAAGVGVGDAGGTVTWVVEPDVGVDVSVVRWMRIGISGSYRFVGAAKDAQLSFAQLSGPAAGLTVKFGSF